MSWSVLSSSKKSCHVRLFFFWKVKTLWFLLYCTNSQPCLKVNILNEITQSALIRALHSGSSATFRHCALQLLGITSVLDPDDGSSSEDNTSDAQSDLTASSDESTSSTGSNIETESNITDKPPDVPSNPDFVARDKGKKKFCAAFNKESQKQADNHEKSKTQEQCSCNGKEDAETGSEASTEDFSDISDDSDIFHLTVDPVKCWNTEQDQDVSRISYIASLLRANPLLPPDPSDAKHESDWCDVQSGVALPRAHCAFSGCSWVNDSPDHWEDNLKQHVKVGHLQCMQLSANDQADFYDFYEAAIQHRCQSTMPSVGVSIDRRSLRYVNDTFNDKSVYNLVCMVCAQSKTHTGLKSMRVNGICQSLTDIKYHSGQELIRMWNKDVDHFDRNFGFRTFMQRYAKQLEGTRNC